MLGMAAVPAVIQFIGFLFMPESPRFLVKAGKEDEAKQVLRRLRGHDSIQEEFNGIKGQVEEAAQQETAFFQVLKRVLREQHLRRALFVGCLLQTVQQLIGINTVMYYSATIIQMSGVHDKQTAVWMASVVALLNFLITFLAIWLVERIGRRTLTLTSLAGTCLSLVLLAIGFHILAVTSPEIHGQRNALDSSQRDPLKSCMKTTCHECIQSLDCAFCFDPKDPYSFNECLSDSDISGNYSTSCDPTSLLNGSLILTNEYCPSPYSWLTLLGLCLYIVFFGPGMGPMPWTINSELFPLWSRSVCYSITTAVNWFFNLLVSLTFLTLTDTMTKQGAFWLYSLLSVIGFVLLFLFLPETKGRSLEADIRDVMEKPSQEYKDTNCKL